MGNITLTGFQGVLYQMFVGEKKYPVAEIADLMNIKASTLYSYIEGVTYFPPDLLKILYNATVRYDQIHRRKPEGEMRIWSFVLADTGLLAVPVEREKAQDCPVERDLLSGHVKFSELTNAVCQAREDGVIDEFEEKQITEQIDDLQRHLEKVRAKTRKTR